MVCPYRHVADYRELTEDETVEVAHLSQRAMQVLTDGGAPARLQPGHEPGLPSPVPGSRRTCTSTSCPRWGGDANFLPIVARTKALPELLSDTRRRLADAWSATPV